MADKKEFECESCGKRTEAAADNPPECCGQKMKTAEPLPVCELSSTAEHARGDDMGEPCDDGRSGS